MPSPLKARHGPVTPGTIGNLANSLQSLYARDKVLHNATTILNDANEPQPDAALRILSSMVVRHGRMRTVIS